RRSGRSHHHWGDVVVLVARELLAKGSKRLVVGEGTRRGGLARERRTTDGSNIFDVLRGGNGDLLLVGFPTGLGSRVVGLPLGALLLEAFLPLVGLGVEALRVLVVALLVVLREHAVERR